MAQYEKSKAEKYAEAWFKEHEFEFTLIKQYISKTKYVVKKNGTSEVFELPGTVTNCKKYMEMFGKSFDMKVEIERLKSK